jgi:hypothetical protein
MDSRVTPTPPEFPQDLGAARPGLEAMAGSALGAIRPSLGKRASRGLARLRQSVDQLAGSQQQIAGTMAKLGTRQQELLHKLASPPPRPAPAPVPKPVKLPESEVH